MEGESVSSRNVIWTVFLCYDLWRREEKGGGEVCVWGGGGEDIALAALFVANSAACDGKCEMNAFVFCFLFWSAQFSLHQVTFSSLICMQKVHAVER